MIEVRKLPRTGIPFAPAPPGGVGARSGGVAQKRRRAGKRTRWSSRLLMTARAAGASVADMLHDTVPIPAGGGERLRFGDVEILVRATAASTGGAMSVFEEIDPVDTPLHVHEHEDELFYALEGEHVFRVGEREHRVGPGGLVFAPRGVPHAQRRVVPRTGRVLVVCTPGGLEGFFRELAAAERAGSLGPDAYARASARLRHHLARPTTGGKVERTRPLPGSAPTTASAISGCCSARAYISGLDQRTTATKRNAAGPSARWSRAPIQPCRAVERTWTSAQPARKRSSSPASTAKGATRSTPPAPAGSPCSSTASYSPAVGGERRRRRRLRPERDEAERDVAAQRAEEHRGRRRPPTRRGTPRRRRARPRRR